MSEKNNTKQVKNTGKPHRWKPGESGNPNGRPKKDVNLTSLMKELLPEKAEYIAPGSTPDDKTWRQVIIKALFVKAAKGDIKAIELVLERTEGKITQPIGGDEDKPIVLKVVYDDRDKGIDNTPS